MELNPNANATYVGDLIIEDHRWNFMKIRDCGSPNCAVEVVKTPISWSSNMDMLMWPHSPNGRYFVKSGYRRLTELTPQPTMHTSSSNDPATVLWKTIWKLKAHEKIKHFMWNLCHNALHTREALWKRKIVGSPVCPIYCNEPETPEHLFLLCLWIEPCWFAAQLGPLPNRVWVFHLFSNGLWIVWLS